MKTDLNLQFLFHIIWALYGSVMKFRVYARFMYVGPHIKFQVQPFIGNNGFIVVYNYMICHLQFDL